MRVTIAQPGDMELTPEHVMDDGRTMVHIADESDYRALLVWLSPAQASQWIAALTPLAASGE